MTLGQLKAMMQAHDLTYEHADDRSSYARGRRQLAEIKAAAKEFPAEVVKATWNAIVDEKVDENFRPQFYWKDTWSK